METKEIIESGFIKAFIKEYFEYKIYSFYPDKNRLLYVLCRTDLEKQQVTAQQIEIVKNEIQRLGNEDLSFAYLLSCEPESISGPNYIEPDKRFDYWLNRFCEHFIDSINTFTPITEACELFKNKFTDEDFEYEFWEIYPTDQKPKVNCLPFIIQREFELLGEIEYSISEFKENGFWEIDFEKFQKFIETSKPIELLFNISELLVQLNRLEMFNELLLPPQPIVESPFSVLEWATIFYYANETKLLSESRLLKTRFEQFMSKHQVNTTLDNFKNSYYEAKRRINEKNDYPINKLELIIPFLKENYKQAVTKVENDIFFLKENKPDY